MFVTADFLAIHYGIDDTIAQFFTDREPPADNLYWKGKQLYVRIETGYIFIPLIVDLFRRLGIPKSMLLGDEYIQLLEKIGHITALEETGRMTHTEAVEQCIALTATNHENEAQYHHIINFIRKENTSFIVDTNPYKALHRGDIFLFTLCALEINDDTFHKAVHYWFALIGLLLMLDDADDITIDQQSGDENTFIESGMDAAGVQAISELATTHLRTIYSLNKSMATTLDKKFIKLAELPLFKQHLNWQHHGIG